MEGEPWGHVEVQAQKSASCGDQATQPATWDYTEDRAHTPPRVQFTLNKADELVLLRVQAAHS